MSSNKSKKSKGGGDKSHVGRKPDPVWSDFVVLGDRGQARCKACTELVSAKIERLKAHMLKCTVNKESSGMTTIIGIF